jgi:hypothetical protein
LSAPPDIIDSIGGWSKSGVGEGYGDGHKIEILHKWMSRIVASRTAVVVSLDNRDRISLDNSGLRGII